MPTVATVRIIGGEDIENAVWMGTGWYCLEPILGGLDKGLCLQVVLQLLKGELVIGTDFSGYFTIAVRGSEGQEDVEWDNG